MLTVTPDSRPQLEGVAGLDWVRRRTWPRSNPASARPLSLVDLFCGCGGLSLGVWEAARLSNRRLDVRLSVDLSKAALDVYRTNFRTDENRSMLCHVESLFGGRKGTLATTSQRALLRRIGATDLLVAGPPCQGHSDLNNSTRRDDPRNSLYLTVPRAAELLRPKVVIIENVPTVIHDSKSVVARAGRWLADLGYHTSTAVVSFAQLGVPQMRKRHVLVGVRARAIEIADMLPRSSDLPCLGRFLAGIEDEPSKETSPFFQPARITRANQRRIDYLFRNDLHNLPDRLRPPCHRDKAHAYVSMYGRMHWDRPAQTLTGGFGSMGQGRYVHPTRSRLLTPHEAARIQGLPDFFDFSTVPTVTALREMIANAVPPQFTASMVCSLLKHGIF